MESIRGADLGQQGRIFTLGLLRIAKREFHYLLVDLVKRKQQTMEESGGPKVSINVVLIADAGIEDEIPDNHYLKPHWARASTETPVWIMGRRSTLCPRNSTERGNG